MAGRDARPALADADAEWPFHGREAELEVVLRALDPDAAPGPRGSVVVAPAGVGKTRLLRETQRAIRALGVPTAGVVATDASARTPYGAVLHLLPDGVGEAADRSTWHAAFAAALAGTDARRPTVLFVDDAQHLDDGSASLLLHLTLQGVITPVVSVRAEERLPAPVTVLWKDRLCQRVDLQPLTTQELGGLIRSVLGGQVSERTLVRLGRVCDGNVLFARELVSASIEGGSLRRRDGVWSWDERVVLAPRLVDAVGARLARLGVEGRRALSAVALAEPLTVAVAEQVCSPSSLVTLEEAGVVRVAGPRGHEDLRLAHPLYGEVMLEQVGRLGRRHLVTVLAEAVQADPHEAERSVVRIASWRLDAGLGTDWCTLHRAAVRANETFDHVLAARLARAAVDAAAADETAPRAALVVELARALVGSNDAAQAHRLLDDVEEAVVASGDDALVDGFVDVRFWASYFGLGRVTETQRIFDRLDARHRDRFVTYRACLALGDGQPQRALDLAEQGLEASDASDLQQLLALETAGESLACLGRGEAAGRVWSRMHDVSASGVGRVAAAGAEADLQALFFTMLDGRVDDALPEVGALHEQVEGSGDVVNRGLACLTFGRCLLLAGQVERARVLLLDAVADFGQVDLGGSRAWALALLGTADALTGRLEQARASVGEARTARPEGGSARLSADLVEAEVWLAVADGDHTRAVHLARAGAERFPGLPLGRAWLLHLATRIGDTSREVVDALREIARGVECAGPGLLADHASALRAGDGHALESVAEQLAARGMLPLAAEAAHQAARAHRHAGSTDNLHRAAARARVLTASCDAISTPGLTDPVPATRLSRREAEVARLAASGASNAEIADRLVVSVRTVESHLYQAFAKLGVQSRTELSRYLSVPDTSDEDR